MRNLAGNPECDRTISRELERAGIAFVRLDRAEGEVPSRLRGRLGPIEFARGPTYWVADGPVPLLAALDIYVSPIGRHHVHVCGRENSPPPEPPWLRWYTSEGASVLPIEHKATYAQMAERVPYAIQCMPAVMFHDEPTALGAKGFIALYHIDSLDGLQVFCSTLRQHGLERLARPVWWATHHGAMARGIGALPAMPARALDEPMEWWEGDTKDLEPVPGGAPPRSTGGSSL